MLTILGVGGWFPAHGRETACALLRDGDRAIMIDAGTGLGRQVERPALFEGIKRLDILLTHFHLDHLAGIAYLPALARCEQTTVWGPGRLLYGASTGALIGRLAREPFHPVPLEDQDIEVRDLPANELELGGVRVAIRRQDRHSAPTVALRFGDELAWITDTAYDPDSAPFARGCRMLAHEAWFTSMHPRTPDIHSSAAAAARVATNAEVDRLALIHLPPFQESVQSLLEEARAQGPETIAAVDGTAFSDVAI